MFLHNFPDTQDFSPFLAIFSFSGHEISIESESFLAVLGSHIAYA